MQNSLGVWLLYAYGRKKVFHRSKQTQYAKNVNGGSHSWNPPFCVGCFFTAPFFMVTRTGIEPMLPP